MQTPQITSFNGKPQASVHLRPTSFNGKPQTPAHRRPTSFNGKPQASASEKTRGLSLLEVVLALTILAMASAYLAQAMNIATTNALKAERLTQAELVAESVMNQVIAGVLPAQPVTWTPYYSPSQLSQVNLEGASGWLYQIQPVQTEMEGMVGLQVAVQKQSATGVVEVEYDLFANRWIIDPTLGLDVPPEEETEDASGAASSSSTAPTSSSTGSGASGATGGGAVGGAGGFPGGVGGLPGGGGRGGLGGAGGGPGGGRGGAGGPGVGGPGGGGRGAGAGGGGRGAGGGPGGGGAGGGGGPRGAGS
ncbi:MAG: prepilin-type N-terminal cleavage/methylation domain-containing protein [Pirellulaceae bacterium]